MLVRLWCAFTTQSMAVAYASSVNPKPKVGMTISKSSSVASAETHVLYFLRARPLSCADLVRPRMEIQALQFTSPHCPGRTLIHERPRGVLLRPLQILLHGLSHTVKELHRMDGDESRNRFVSMVYPFTLTIKTSEHAGVINLLKGALVLRTVPPNIPRKICLC